MQPQRADHRRDVLYVEQEPRTARHSVHPWYVRHRPLTVAATVALLLILAVIAASFFVNEPLRRYMERRINARLHGYTAHVLAVELHALGFAITLRDLTITQNAHPKPPVAWFPELDASEHWRALLRARLVAAVHFDRPHLYINLTQVQHENTDPVPLKDKGWQAALESIYPLKINQLSIDDGDLLYIDTDPHHPLYVSQVAVVAENIRNIRSPEHVYPSDIQAAGLIFGSGKFRMDGHANFLAAPYAGVDADITLEHIDVSHFKSILERMNIRLTSGTLSARGHVEYAPNIEHVRLRTATLRRAQIDYVHTEATAANEVARVRQVERTADKLSHTSEAVIRIDQLHVADSTIGYANSSGSGFRVFLADADLTVENLSNQARDGRTSVVLTGQFMGSGRTFARASLLPAAKTADVDMAVMIEETQLTSLNDLLRMHGGFDVVAGQFSAYSELTIKNGEISGYLKPIFRNANVYSPPQDAKKPILHQLYEALVGGAQTLLQNHNREVGAKIDIAGRADSPKTSTVEIVLGLIKNAFFKAIRHGFEPG